MGERVYFGQPGHFVAAHNCRFHVHTHVNGYCVSTVGDYYPRQGPDTPTEIGLNRLFETMVFKLDASGSDLESLTEIDFAGYNDRDAANAGHEVLVRKWDDRCWAHDDCQQSPELGHACWTAQRQSAEPEKGNGT